MDANRFDRIARLFAPETAPTAGRRSLFGALAGAAAAIGAREVAEAGCAKRCCRCKTCKHGRCRKKSDGTACGTGKLCDAGRCVACTITGDACSLTAPGLCCSQRCCNSGVEICSPSSPCCC